MGIMPSTKKRINLTISDSLYERIQAYKDRTGVSNDAAACTQLIVSQLNALDSGALLSDFMKSMPLEDLLKISNAGLVDLKHILDKNV